MFANVFNDKRRPRQLFSSAQMIRCSCMMTDPFSSNPGQAGRMRRDAAFSALADKSRGLSTALRYDFHLRRTHRRSLQELYRFQGAGLQNKPTKAAKSQLNGKDQALNGGQKQENPTNNH